MPNLRVEKTVEFYVISLTGEKLTVEEFTYYQFNTLAPHTQDEWTPCKKIYCLYDARPTHNLQPVDHISENIYEIRRTGERITRIS
jgi:hypothetical protein